MSFKEEYIYWTLIKQLVAKHSYRIISSSDNQLEIWLENDTDRNKPLIRLKRADLDWSNSIKRDLESAAQHGDKIRKHLTIRNCTVLTIYVSQFPPVDDYSDLLEGPNTNENYPKITLETIIFETEKFEQSLSLVNQHLGLHVDIADKRLEDIEEAELRYLQQSALASTIKKNKSDQSIFTYGKPIFTYVFIVIQILVFALLEFKGGSENSLTLLDFGAKYTPLIIEGEWWRLFAPMVLHIGFVHLATNTLSLYFLGLIVERIFGSGRFLLIYLFAGFMGNLASFLFVDNISAGASTSISGLLGALLLFGVVYPKLFFRTMGVNVIVILVMNIAIGFSFSGIDNWGHLGGLIGGFLAASIVMFPKKKKLAKQLLTFLATIVFVFSLVTYGYSKADLDGDYTMAVAFAQGYIQKEEYNKAYKLLKPYLNHANAPEVYFTAAYIEIQNQDYDPAKKHLQVAIKQKPDFDQAYFNLALIYMENNQYAEARPLVEKAIELNSKEENYQKALDIIRLKLGE